MSNFGLLGTKLVAKVFQGEQKILCTIEYYGQLYYVSHQPFVKCPSKPIDRKNKRCLYIVLLNDDVLRKRCTANYYYFISRVS